MGETGQNLVFPTKEDIAALNRSHILQTGGFLEGAGKFHNESSLEWVLEAIQYPLFGSQPYPTISEKAGILGWVIIHNHVFHDGNKRTGMITVMAFLEINGFYLHAGDEEILEVAVRVANPSPTNYSKEKFIQWVKNHLDVLIPPSY